MSDVVDPPRCERCTAAARWSICDLEGDRMDPIVRWFACPLHVHVVLAGGDWEVDAVQVYDLQQVAEAPIGT